MRPLEAGEGDFGHLQGPKVEPCAALGSRGGCSGLSRTDSGGGAQLVLILNQ